MPLVQRSTVAERLYWTYANHAMAEMAVDNGDAAYTTKHYMVRARLFKGLIDGTMSPRSLMRDQRTRMRMPQECVYCGDTTNLTIDHIIPTNRGGADIGDNAIWACRKCNSSKSDRDLFEWWTSCRGGFPPLFIVRIYLKQAIDYFVSCGLMGCHWTEVQNHPFCFETMPMTYPEPASLVFTLFHARMGYSRSARKQ